MDTLTLHLIGGKMLYSLLVFLFIAQKQPMVMHRSKNITIYIYKTIVTLLTSLIGAFTSQQKTLFEVLIMALPCGIVVKGLGKT